MMFINCYEIFHQNEVIQTLEQNRHLQAKLFFKVIRRRNLPINYFEYKQNLP